jgi:hypothetical protein
MSNNVSKEVDISESNDLAKEPGAAVESLLGPSVSAHPKQYLPSNEEEKVLDRQINLKFDLVAIPLVALGFLVRLPSRPDQLILRM